MPKEQVLKAHKPKKCKVCRGSFEPRNSLHIVCSPKCGIAYAESQRKAKEAKLAKLDRQQHRERKEKLKTLADYKREAQAAVNAYVRLRDAHLGCVSCDKPATWQGQWHASHFRSVGAAPHLRFNLWNIHKSCSVCNNHLSGNILGYKPELIRRIGIDRVEWLESCQATSRHDIEYIKRIKKVFAKKRRRLEASRNAVLC